MDSRLSVPECDAKGGFYSDVFTITLKSEQENKIYYTLDGSVPSLKSEIYKGPVAIYNRTKYPSIFSSIPTSPRWQPPLGDVFKGTVLRAICVSNDNKKSKELVHTFFIDEKGVNRYSFPVVSLTVDPDDFFGYKDGIYVLGKNYEDKRDYIKKKIPLNLPWWEYPSNYLKRGANGERNVHIEFFENNGNKGFETDAKIQINGNATRGFSQKALRISFSKKYGIEKLDYFLFPDKEQHIFDSFILRNSGNDWSKTLFRDVLLQSLMKDTKLDMQAYRPVIVFINAEYWGIHTLRERLDENYIANKYHISADSIFMIEADENLSFKDKGYKEFENFIKFIKKNNLSDKMNYNQVKKLMDVDNFIDFVIANVYCSNSDWPGNNVKLWRYKAIENGNDSVGIRDGRWRWMLYDTDWGFGFTDEEGYRLNLLEKAKEIGSIGIIFDGLLKNETFRQQFTKRFEFHLQNTFKAEIVIAKINELHDQLMPEMPEHINRWRVIGSFKKWEEYVDELRLFAQKRPEIQTQQLYELMDDYK